MDLEVEENFQRLFEKEITCSCKNDLKPRKNHSKWYFIFGFNDDKRIDPAYFPALSFSVSDQFTVSRNYSAKVEHYLFLHAHCAKI